MVTMNELLRSRLGIALENNITFENLPDVLERMAKHIPFENMRIMQKNITAVTQAYLMDKLFAQKEGGLCYELNTALQLFLIENGFEAMMVRGVVYNHMNQSWNKVGRTHVTLLVPYKGQMYLVDTGFGGNLPLKPVPLNGEVVTSVNGEFRVEQQDSEYGDYLLYMKLKHKDEDWKLGYAFHSKDVVTTYEVLNQIQATIADHPESPFNKAPLLTKLTDRGNIILSQNSFIEWKDGKMKKTEIDEQQFEEWKQMYFY